MTKAAHVGLSGLRKGYASKGDDVTLTRFVKDESFEPTKPKQMWLGNLQNKAFEEGRSIFSRRGVKSAADMKNVLVSGHNNVKIGRDVRKGPLRGYWIYTLSLEERKTCPQTCHHWRSCYGNNMPYAKRVRHDDALLPAIERDLIRLLATRGRVGILVRLHALGDFYSKEYVVFWARMLETHPNLAVYGYTARRRGTAIGDQIAMTKRRYGSRFAIRWSDGGQREDCTVSIHNAADAPDNAVVCPEQTGKTAACATCGLCWGTTKNVAFIEH